ncbi:DNA-processing protein DprA [Candidatus Dependentiae bacterium]|nr:DNA-processing protein DprA [Candidatus Dependentiae bacterium]
MISFPQLTLLHLSLIEGVGAATVANIVAGKPLSILWQDIYGMSISDLMAMWSMSEAVAQRIVDGLADGSLLERELALIATHNISWCTVLDERYPPLLKEIHAPPAVLYYRGNVYAAHRHSLALVGSRKVNEYGIAVIKMLVPDLVAAGWCLVSGGAIGADSWVHRQTIHAGGTTIAVLGSGLLKPYPQSNKTLFDEIVEKGGAVVSPFALQASALPGNFPARNRIISGLSKGCVVVQAAAQSGALITAHYALDQGRDVFAVPGSIADPLSAGCHHLVQQGAKLIHSSNDILSEYGQQTSLTVAQSMKAAVTSDKQISGIESRDQVVDGKAPAKTTQHPLVDLCKVPRSLDELLSASHMDYAQLTTALFDLQVAGIMRQDFLGMWHAVDV